MDVLASIQSALISGKRDQVMQETNKAVSEGIKPHKILNEGLIPGMDVVGAVLAWDLDLERASEQLIFGEVPSVLT